MKEIKINCNHCRKEFFVKMKEVKRGNGKFCSRTCSGARRKGIKLTKPNVKCRYCGIPFYKNSSKKKCSKHGIFFCTRKCKDLGQRVKSNIKEIQPPHYKSGESDYKKIAKANKVLKCNRCSYDKIPEILEVHHLDRNRNNNNLSNLEIICPNCHQEDHFFKKDGRYYNRK